MTVDAGDALRVKPDGRGPRRNAAPEPSYRETLRVERDLRYTLTAVNGDPWYDTLLVGRTSPVAADFAFATEGRLAGPVEVTVGLWGMSSWSVTPDHHVAVAVNGVELADELFDGQADHPVSFEVPGSHLVAGANTLTVKLPSDTGARNDLVVVDHFEVRYPRHFAARDGELTFTAAGEVFEVAGLATAEVLVYRRGPRGVELLTHTEVTGVPGDYRVRFRGGREEATYHVVSAGAIRTPAVEPGRAPADLLSGPAELLIISHPDFLAGLEPLVAAREAQGWTVKVVDVEDVYEQLGFGVFDPEAIHAYVAFAAENLGTEAVLLVGGDTYDYFDLLGLGSVSFIPSLYGRTGDIVRFAPADGLYADLDGDEVPDLAIGRFPVRTAADLEAMLDKTFAFEAGRHRRSLVLAADDYDRPSRFDFTQASEQMAVLAPSDWQVRRVYLDALGVSEARSELLGEMNAGVAVTSFMGHSGPTAWSFDGLFSAADATALTNAGRPTVVTQWGCWTTYYVSPRHETLGDTLLLSGDRGAAAVLGATTLTEARSERILGLEIFRRLFVPGETLGGAILEAKRRLAALEDPAVLDVLIGWNLLGDPTLSVVEAP